MRLNALGTQLLLELRGCDRQVLNDLPLIRRTLLEAAERVGATVIGHSFHQFSPQGVTGVVAIAESHLAIHTWPEHGYAAVDVFTCGDSFHPEVAADFIIAGLGATDSTALSVKRGILQAPVPERVDVASLLRG